MAAQAGFVSQHRATLDANTMNCERRIEVR
jgi:hypothetical protein